MPKPIDLVFQKIKTFQIADHHIQFQINSCDPFISSQKTPDIYINVLFDNDDKYNDGLFLLREPMTNENMLKIRRNITTRIQKVNKIIGQFDITALTNYKISYGIKETYPNLFNCLQKTHYQDEGEMNLFKLTTMSILQNCDTFNIADVKSMLGTSPKDLKKQRMKEIDAEINDLSQDLGLYQSDMQKYKGYSEYDSASQTYNSSLSRIQKLETEKNKLQK